MAELAKVSLSNSRVDAVELDRFLCHFAESDALKPALRNRIFFHSALNLFEQSADTPFSEGARPNPKRASDSEPGRHARSRKVSVNAGICLGSLGEGNWLDDG